MSASSGTSALIGAILATAGPAAKNRPMAVLPAFTFVATAVAAERCGYELQFVDVDADTWMLNPAHIARLGSLEGVGLVIPVAPFGRPVPQRDWKILSQAYRETEQPCVSNDREKRRPALINCLE